MQVNGVHIQNFTKDLKTKKMQRWDIINELIKAHDYKTYLEIGYYKGWSFDRVECRNKLAVDPNPSKTEYQEKLDYGKSDVNFSMDEIGIPEANYDYSVYKLTSDDFFQKREVLVEKFTDRFMKFDIIFIDGLHESEQVLRDIKNSIKYLNEGGTIVLHDMLPPTEKHVTTGDEHGNWNGDCYKAILQFLYDEENDEWEYNTVDTDWGVGILRKGDGFTFRAGRNKYRAAINNWGYFYTHNYLMNIISPEQFIENVKLGVI
jgi:hypothetical protein